MTTIPNKVLVIGLDAASPTLIEKHISEGGLPTLKKLIENGTYAENCLAPFPTITPPNWTTIGTGATVGTHSVTDFWIQKKGGPLDPSNVLQAFNSQNSKAEFIWEALDKAGKKCIVLNWPASWPSRMKNGIIMGGRGLAVNETHDGFQGLSSLVDVCSDQLITTGIYPFAIKGKFEEASGWLNVTDMGRDPLEMKAELNFPNAISPVSTTTWWVLCRELGKSGYDTIALSPTKDFKDAFCTLKPGEWSHKITTSIKLTDGSVKEVFFKCKLLELSEDAEDFRLFMTALSNLDNWLNPPQAVKQITSEEGLPVPGGGMGDYAQDWIDLDTWVDLMGFYCQHLGDTAVSFMKNNKWDAFFMHAHPPDYVYHIFMTDLYTELTPDEEKRKTAWKRHNKVYEHIDRMIARILKAAGEDNLVVTVCDHGAVADGHNWNPYLPLAKAGLAAYEDLPDTFISSLNKNMPHFATEVKQLFRKADSKKSRAIALRVCYIYVNLKGRDPGGIVELYDYDKTVQEIIDALYTYVDPKTGKRPVSLALSRQDARILGLHGEGIGDVVYAIYPEYGSQHGNILPTAQWGPGSLKALLTFTGPGIKKGHRLERTCKLEDVVPTICYLMDWPLPTEAEGAVLYQAFENPLRAT